MDFPIELFFLISSFCNNQTLFKLIQINKVFYNNFSPLVKKRLTFNLYSSTNCPIDYLSKLTYLESKLLFNIIKYIPDCILLNHIRFTNAFLNKNSFKIYINPYSINVILFCDFNSDVFNLVFSNSSINHPVFNKPISFIQHSFSLSPYTSEINFNNTEFSMLFYYVF